MIVFSKKWFEKNNGMLCRLANSFVGDFIFGFKKMGHYTENRIVKITPNSVCELVSIDNDKVTLKEHFFNKNEYSVRLYKRLYPLWMLFHIWDIVTKPLPKLNLGFDSLTVYPDADPESTSVDGTCWQYYNAGSGQDWATIKAASGYDAEDNNSSNAVAGLYCDSSTDNFQMLRRGVLLFDTSSLSGAEVSAATFSVYGQSKLGNFTTSPATEYNTYSSNPASNTAVVVGDYDSLGTTAFCDTNITFSGWDTSDYNDWSLNSSGISAIDVDGITKLGIRESIYDAGSSTPSWEAWKQERVNCYFADNGSNKPKLVITYTVALTGTNFLIMF